MTETKQLYINPDPNLSRVLQSISDRLDKLEGLRSNPAFFSGTFEFPDGVTESQVLTAGASDDATFEDMDAGQVDHNTTKNYVANEHVNWPAGPAGKSMDLSGGSYLVMRRIRQAAQPTPTAGEMLIWSDSDDDSVHLVYEDADGGTVDVTLT